MKKFVVILLLVVMPLIQGCALGMLAAGVGALKHAGTKRMEAYNDYVSEMEKLNFEREKAGLEPRPIPTYEEWVKGAKAMREVEEIEKAEEATETKEEVEEK